jgi:hypothetical protein
VKPTKWEIPPHKQKILLENSKFLRTMYRKKSGDLSLNWWDYGQAHDLKKHMILALLIFF